MVVVVVDGWAGGGCIHSSLQAKANFLPLLEA
jgi:hypothetical protein